MTIKEAIAKIYAADDFGLKLSAKKRSSSLGQCMMDIAVDFTGRHFYSVDWVSYTVIKKSITDWRATNSTNKFILVKFLPILSCHGANMPDEAPLISEIHTMYDTKLEAEDAIIKTLKEEKSELSHTYKEKLSAVNRMLLNATKRSNTLRRKK